jgi:hypothetical protein
VGSKILAYHVGKASRFLAFPRTFNDQCGLHWFARTLSRTKRATRFTPDGKAVLYTPDLTAYSSMCLVEAGAFEELPDWE